MIETKKYSQYELGNSNLKDLINNLNKFDGVVMPKNKTEIRILEKQLSQASFKNPLEIFVGSCPDYSHSNGLYDHQSLGFGIPLLTNYHLNAEAQLLKFFDNYGIPYVYSIALADVEAVDQTFANRFTKGDELEFLRRCDSSVLETQKRLNILKDEYNLNGRLESTSFFRLFTREKFMNYQEEYKRLLTKGYQENPKLKTRIDGDTIIRMQMYQKMYNGVMDGMDIMKKQSFYVSRTIRTMAQYLTLGRLISEKNDISVIISHPTRNMSVFNDRNKFPFPGDNNKPQSTIPVFEMDKKVY